MPNETTRDFISRNPRPGMAICLDPQCSPAFGHPHYHEAARSEDQPKPQQTTIPKTLPAMVAEIVKLTMKIERLREALEEYACPGRGACPSPWDVHGCSLRESCGLIAADALAESQPHG